MALPVSFRIAIHPCILFIAQNWIYAGEARENLNDYSLLAYQEYRFSFLNFNLRIFFFKSAVPFTSSGTFDKLLHLLVLLFPHLQSRE